MLRELLIQNGIAIPSRERRETYATVDVIAEPASQRLRVTLPNSPPSGPSRLAYHSTSSASEETTSPEDDARQQRLFRPLPQLPQGGENDSSSPPSDDREIRAPSPGSRHPYGLDTEQIGIDFVLSLEEPCLPHTRGEAQNPSQPIPTGHALTTQAPLLTHAPAILESRSQWSVPAVEIERLLELSSNLNLEGELTPVQTWSRIRRWPGFERCDRRRLEVLRDRMRDEIQCYG